ncbi:MAG: NAD(P)/FAD-dependent oxidoreductase [Planctomycetes bacterium]|nr:NAD(P)/FAD-dependent oxidoreductase [Planctomycetota bacterium]
MAGPEVCHERTREDALRPLQGRCPSAPGRRAEGVDREARRRLDRRERPPSREGVPLQELPAGARFHEPRRRDGGGAGPSPRHLPRLGQGEADGLDPQDRRAHGERLRFRGKGGRAARVTHVVVLGGGFGGLWAARALRKAPVRVTLVDRRNHHLFQPLLYQVATAALNPSNIAVPIRRILRRQRNAAVALAEAVSVDVARRRVILSDGEIGYDHLIVAVGARHSYFGRDEWAVHAPGLKSIEDALDIRRRVFLAFETAELHPDRRREWMTFAIVGGGPTGVELAGALAEISRFTLAADFRTIDPREARILLLEGGDRVLSSLHPDLSAKAERDLRRLGVEVRTKARVTAVDERGVAVGDERIPARTVLWAAGIAASPLLRSLGAPLDRAGRVKVTPELVLPGHADVFVVGDAAYVESDGKPVPGLAPAAIQEGVHAARNVLRALCGEPLLPFRYEDRGILATIGRAAAVADIRGLRLSGLVAWLTWVFVHIFFLIGFRNRFIVMFEWVLAYLTFDRGARLITGDARSILPPPDTSVRRP